jgi:hypothetical protein
MDIPLVLSLSKHLFEPNSEVLRDHQLEWSPKNVTPVKTGVQFRSIL